MQGSKRGKRRPSNFFFEILLVLDFSRSYPLNPFSLHSRFSTFLSFQSSSNLFSPSIAVPKMPSPFQGIPSLSSLSKLLLDDQKTKNIIVICGAGISTSAGIPDFRSPGTGLYSNLQRYDLPFPEAVFEIDYFLKKPEAFFSLSKELCPGQYKPTATHIFFRLLHEKKMLNKCFTQNSESLNSLALPLHMRRW